MESLKPGSIISNNMGDDFRQFLENLSIISFYETRPLGQCGIVSRALSGSEADELAVLTVLSDCGQGIGNTRTSWYKGETDTTRYRPQ